MGEPLVAFDWRQDEHSGVWYARVDDRPAAWLKYTLNELTVIYQGGVYAGRVSHQIALAGMSSFAHAKSMLELAYVTRTAGLVEQSMRHEPWSSPDEP